MKYLVKQFLFLRLLVIIDRNAIYLYYMQIDINEKLRFQFFLYLRPTCFVLLFPFSSSVVPNNFFPRSSVCYALFLNCDLSPSSLRSSDNLEFEAHHNPISSPSLPSFVFLLFNIGLCLR